MLLKRKLALLGLLVIGAALSATAAVQSFLRVQPVEKTFPPVEKKYTSFESAAYILMERDGYVAVFSSNPHELLEMTSIPVSTLPAADRALLTDGITAVSRYELLSLLEDLNS